MIRFVVVGAGNTVFGYGTYLGFLWSGLPYYVAWGGSLVLALLLGFYMSGRFVFQHAARKSLVLYVLSWLAIYLLNIGALQLLFGLGLSEELAPLFMLPVNVPLSYLSQKYVVFR